MNANLVGALFGLVALGLGLRAVAPYTTSLTTMPQDTAVGGQVATLASAVRTHITNYYTSLLSAANAAGGTLDIPISNAACSPAWSCVLVQPFANLNTFGQTYAVKFAVVSGRMMALLVSCNGATISDVRALRIARTAQPLGVAITSEAPTVLTSPTMTATYPVSAFNFGSCRPAAGRIGALMASDGGQVTPPFLHRFPSATNEPNTQHVTIYGDQSNPAQPVDIIGFRDVTTTRNVSAGQDLSATRHVTAGQNVTASLKVSGGGGLRSDLIVSQGAGCSDYGLIGRDGSGNLYTCYNGYWDNIRHGTLTALLSTGQTNSYYQSDQATWSSQPLSFYLDRPATVVTSTNFFYYGGYVCGNLNVQSAQINFDGEWCGTNVARTNNDGQSQYPRANATCVKHVGAGWHTIQSNSGYQTTCGGHYPQSLYYFVLSYSAMADSL